jgi:hypothetical protein
MDGLEGALSTQPTVEELETLMRVPTGHSLCSDVTAWMRINEHVCM